MDILRLRVFLLVGVNVSAHSVITEEATIARLAGVLTGVEIPDNELRLIIRVDLDGEAATC